MGGKGFVDRAVEIITPRGGMFALACTPSADREPSRDWVVFLNTGRVHVASARAALATALGAEVGGDGRPVAAHRRPRRRRRRRRGDRRRGVRGRRGRRGQAGAPARHRGRVRLARRARASAPLHDDRSLLGSDALLPAGTARPARGRGGDDQPARTGLGRPPDAAQGLGRCAAGRRQPVVTGARRPRPRLAMGAEGDPRRPPAVQDEDAARAPRSRDPRVPGPAGSSRDRGHGRVQDRRPGTGLPPSAFSAPSYEVGDSSILPGRASRSSRGPTTPSGRCGRTDFSPTPSSGSCT